MKIFVCCSRYLYERAQPVIHELENAGHKITRPNNFDDAERENRTKEDSPEKYAAWKAEMLKKQSKKVANNDAVLVLNFEKEGRANYIGGATFLEIFKAWELGKKIFLYNPIPEGILHDEITGMNPVVLNGNLSQLFQI